MRHEAAQAGEAARQPFFSLPSAARAGGRRGGGAPPSAGKADARLADHADGGARTGDSFRHVVRDHGRGQLAAGHFSQQQAVRCIHLAFESLSMLWRHGTKARRRTLQTTCG
jgi:hypothetical protein